MAGTHRRKRHRGAALSAWLGAGTATVGIGAALISGAALAQAQTGGSATHADHGGRHTANKSTAPHDKHDKGPSTKPVHATRAGTRSHAHPSAAAGSTAATRSTATPAAATDTPTKRRARDSTTNIKTTSELAAATSTSERANSATLAVAASESGSATAAIEKTSRRTTASQSSTSTTRSDRTTDKSTPLAALATVSALASTPVETENAASSTTASTATGTSTSWLNGQTVTPGASVKLSLQEISQAQKALGANLVPQMFLSVAKWALNTWQSTNAGVMAFYAKNSTGVIGAFAKFALDMNEALPGLAQVALYSAEATTSSGSATRALIGQAAQDGKVYGTVKLTTYNDAVPTVEISINGGPMVKVLVDTGSSGLVINNSSVGTANSLGNAIGSGTSGYTGGPTYAFDIYNTTVDFGNGIVTAPTAVDIVTAGTEAAYEKYLSVDGVVGVLGIGANSAGPGPSLVTSALPGELKNGVFIDTANGVLQFGPNPRPVRVAVSGSPYTAGVVKVPVLGVTAPINLAIDSGGIYGTIPSTVWTAVGETQVPGGMEILVYSADGSTLLYSYTTTNTNAPRVTTDATNSDQMNTGFTPFANNAMYIAYTTPQGETDFDL